MVTMVVNKGQMNSVLIHIPCLLTACHKNTIYTSLKYISAIKLLNYKLMLFQDKQKPMEVILNQLTELGAIQRVQLRNRREKCSEEFSDSSLLLIPIGNTATRT